MPRVPALLCCAKTRTGAQVQLSAAGSCPDGLDARLALALGRPRARPREQVPRSLQERAGATVREVRNGGQVAFDGFDNLSLGTLRIRLRIMIRVLVYECDA